MRYTYLKSFILLFFIPFFVSAANIKNVTIKNDVSCNNPVITGDPSSTTACEGADVTFNIVETGATSYQWQVDDGTGFVDIVDGGVYSGATTIMLSLTGVTSSMNGYLYRCIACDMPCCTNSNAATLTVTTLNISITSTDHVSCNGGNDGEIIISVNGGTSPYTYAWSPSGGSGPKASNLAANTYTCLVTDVDACTKTITVTINEPSALVTSILSQNDVTGCSGFTNGSASVSASGGTFPYSYSWSPSGGTSASASNLGAGTYTCTITDANGCTQSETIIINEPPALNISITSQTNVSCNGGFDGSLTASASGGTGAYNYLWTPGGSHNTTISNLFAGTYTCRVSDANGCTTTVSTIVTQPSVISLSVSSQTNVSCYANFDGTATIDAIGGTGNYLYDWSPGGETTSSISGLSAGTYTCMVTDDNSCTKTISVIITEPSEILVSITSQNNILCYGDNNGSATASATGGLGPHTYYWMPSGNSFQQEIGLTAGTYTCLVSDSVGCFGMTTVTITEPQPVSISTNSQTDPSCYGKNDGSISLTASGGTGNLNYAWSPSGGNSATATGLSGGTYTCTVTDDNLCSSVISVTINNPAIITSSQNVAICYGADYVLPGGQTVNLAGTYYDTLSTSDGCDSLVITSLSVNSQVDTSVVVNGLMITANATVGATYQWIDCSNNTPISGQTGQTFTATANGDYAVIVTQFGCSDTSRCININNVGILEISNTTINIYPNPSNGVFTVDINENSTVLITDALGRVVYNEQLNSGKQMIDLSEEKSGIYIVMINMQSGAISNSKIIKN